MPLPYLRGNTLQMGTSNAPKEAPEMQGAPEVILRHF